MAPPLLAPTRSFWSAPSLRRRPREEFRDGTCASNTHGTSASHADSTTRRHSRPVEPPLPGTAGVTSPSSRPHPSNPELCTRSICGLRVHCRCAFRLDCHQYAQHDSLSTSDPIKALCSAIRGLPCRSEAVSHVLNDSASSTISSHDQRTQPDAPAVPLDPDRNSLCSSFPRQSVSSRVSSDLRPHPFLLYPYLRDVSPSFHIVDLVPEPQGCAVDAQHDRYDNYLAVVYGSFYTHVLVIFGATSYNDFLTLLAQYDPSTAFGFLSLLLRPPLVTTAPQFWRCLPLYPGSYRCARTLGATCPTPQLVLRADSLPPTLTPVLSRTSLHCAVTCTRSLI